MPDDVAGFPLRSGARVPTYISLRLRCRHRQYLNGPGRPPSPGIAEGEGRRGSMNESNVADFVQCGAGAVLARAPRGATRERAELDGRARVQGIGEGGPPWPRAALRKASPTASGGPPAEPRPRGADDARVVTSGSAAGSAAGGAEGGSTRWGRRRRFASRLFFALPGGHPRLLRPARFAEAPSFAVLDEVPVPGLVRPQGDDQQLVRDRTSVV